ncbi:MAG: Sec-independent protein translocase protein TatB [Steroidobacteraceae bacterium]
MFEVGFMELALIFVVALVVLGPTRLPGLVRQVGRWIGKARAVARDFQRQLEQEANLEELNKFTERTRQQASQTTPPPPPEFTGAPPADDPSIHIEPDPPAADSAYPYGTPSPAPATPEPSTPVSSEPQPGDDTYSHAHATGGAAPGAAETPVKQV